MIRPMDIKTFMPFLDERCGASECGCYLPAIKVLVEKVKDMYVKDQEKVEDMIAQLRTRGVYVGETLVGIKWVILSYLLCAESVRTVTAADVTVPLKHSGVDVVVLTNVTQLALRKSVLRDFVVARLMRDSRVTILIGDSDEIKAWLNQIEDTLKVEDTWDEK